MKTESRLSVFVNELTRRPRSGLKVVRAFTNPNKIPISNLSPKMKFPFPRGGRGWQPTFDAESRKC